MHNIAQMADDGIASTSKWGLVLRTLAVIVCVTTLLPLLRTDAWWVRLFDFPRIQIAVLAGAVFICSFLYLRDQAWDRYLMLATVLAIVVQLAQIFPYTPLAKKQVMSAAGHGPEVRVLAFNVLQFNRNVKSLLNLVSEWKPDLILLTETDEWWTQQTSVLKEQYPFFISEPKTNTYGITLYSRLELVQPGIRYLIQKDVPSIRAQVKLPDDRLLYFYGVHPKPPGVKTPRGEVPDSAPRDAELIVIAREAKGLNAPTIVAGDFNDVAWSHTTRLFQRISGLLDPRRGRGLYNTFHAKHRLLRFPVDHVFHSEHLTLLRMERLPAIGSTSRFLSR